MSVLSNPMNLPELSRTLLAAARRVPRDERVPYAFEQRVMARLQAAPPAVLWAALVRSLWYGAAACALVAVLLNVWSAPAAQDEEHAHAFSRGVEDCLLAPTSADEFEGLW